MLKKDAIITGVLVALIFPVMAFVSAHLLKYNLYLMNKPALPYFIALALNLVLIRISIKKGFDKTGRGIMLATFVFMVVVFIYKIHPIR
jgi:hypothetical protein